MSKLTRYFLIGSVGILIVGLSIGLVAYYNGSLTALTRSGPDELQFVPANATVVAYADVQRIMKSNFRQRVKQLEGTKSEAGQQEFRDQTGIDIENDIDSVIGYMTTEGTESTHGGGVVIAKGRFNPQRISDFVKQKGGTTGEYGKTKRPFMTFANSDRPDKGGALAFLGDNQVVVGSADAVRRTIDVADMGPQPGDLAHNEKMMALIGQVDNGTAWVVGRFDALSSKAHLPEQVASQIPPISWFSASTNIDGGISGHLSVEATDDKAAANLLSVIQGLKGLAALQARSNNVPTQMQQMLDSLQLSQGGEGNKTLTLHFSLPSEMLDALTTLGKGMPRKK
jgi:hypothetical protein